MVSGPIGGVLFCLALGEELWGGAGDEEFRFSFEIVGFRPEGRDALDCGREARTRRHTHGLLVVPEPKARPSA